MDAALALSFACDAWYLKVFRSVDFLATIYPPDDTAEGTVGADAAKETAATAAEDAEVGCEALAVAKHETHEPDPSAHSEPPCKKAKTPSAKAKGKAKAAAASPATAVAIFGALRLLANEP